MYDFHRMLSIGSYDILAAHEPLTIKGFPSEPFSCRASPTPSESSDVVIR